MLGTLCLAWVELLYPFGRDQGNYAYPAWAWLEGQMPYRDVYVFKPPGTVWIHALAQVLFGHSMVAVRILDIGWTVATALTIFAIVRRWSGGNGLAAPAAGLLYSFLYTNFDFWNTCQTDGWFNLPLALAILLTTRVWTRESKDGVLVVAGALLGLAMMFKYTAAAMALPIAGILLAAAWPDRRFARLFGQLALGVVGAAAVIGATGYWLWANGAIAGFLDSQAVLVPAYVAKTGKTSGFLDKPALLYDRLTKLKELRFELLLLCLGLPLVAVRFRREPAMLFAVLWYVGGLASTVAQNKYFRYHFLSTLPGAAILGAFAVAAALQVARSFHRRAPAVLALAMAIALFASSNFPPRFVVGARVLTGDMTLRQYWKRKDFKLDKKPLVQVYDAADRVAALSEPGERVFLWGYDPVINFVAKRLTVSRFLYNYPFAVSWGDRRYEDELMGALRATPPEWFVLASDDANKTVTGNPADSKQLFDEFPALNQFVAERYAEVETVNRYTIYRRNP